MKKSPPDRSAGETGHMRRNRRHHDEVSVVRATNPLPHVPSYPRVSYYMLF